MGLIINRQSLEGSSIIFNTEHRIEIIFSPFNLQGVWINILYFKAIVFQPENNILDTIAEIIGGLPNNKIGDYVK